MDIPESYNEFTIATVGNVDSGKSTLTGVLTHPEFCSNIQNTLDDGNGSARDRILYYKHEKDTGRTSSINYNYSVFESKESPRVITMVDLAGHEKYLKTTIRGLTSCYPDMGIVCIDGKITQMTKEHIGIMHELQIPFIVAMTKTDIVPTDVMRNNYNIVKRIAKQCKKIVWEMKSIRDIKFNNRMLNVVKISSKTGYNLDILREYIRRAPHTKKLLTNIFQIDHTYHNVVGFGTVVSGRTGIEISTNDKLFLGPFPEHRDRWIPVRVRSIHNDYRQSVEKIEANTRCCLCIKPDHSAEWLLRIRDGMILTTDQKIKNSVTNIYSVKLKVLHHHSTISSRYEGVINCGSISDVVRFVDLGESSLRTGDVVDIKIQCKRSHYIPSGSKFLIREGTSKCIGVVN